MHSSNRIFQRDNFIAAACPSPFTRIASVISPIPPPPFLEYVFATHKVKWLFPSIIVRKLRPQLLDGSY